MTAAEKVLAEEQRTANLLALAGLCPGDYQRRGLLIREAERRMGVKFTTVQDEDGDYCLRMTIGETDE